MFLKEEDLGRRRLAAGLGDSPEEGARVGATGGVGSAEERGRDWEEVEETRENLRGGRELRERRGNESEFEGNRFLKGRELRV